MDVNLEDFGLKSRPASRRREDISKGTCMMCLLPHEENARDRNILLSPKAIEALGLDPENKDSYVAFNFVGGDKPFLSNITGHNIDALPKGAALRVIFNHKEYLGGYLRAKKIWQHLEGSQEHVKEFMLHEESFSLPSLSFDKDGNSSPLVEQSSYEIPEDEEPGSGEAGIRTAVTSYE